MEVSLTEFIKKMDICSDGHIFTIVSSCCLNRDKKRKVVSPDAILVDTCCLSGYYTLLFGNVDKHTPLWSFVDLEEALAAGDCIDISGGIIDALVDAEPPLMLDINPDSIRKYARMEKLTKAQLVWKVLELIDIAELVEYLGLDVEMEDYVDGCSFVESLGKKTYDEICETLMSAFEMMLTRQGKEKGRKAVRARRCSYFAFF